MNGTSRVHLLDAAGRAIGCGWHPRHSRITWIQDKEAWMRIGVKVKGLCTSRFHKCTLPESWEPPSAMAELSGDQARATALQMEEQTDIPMPPSS